MNVAPDASAAVICCLAAPSPTSTVSFIMVHYAA